MLKNGSLAGWRLPAAAALLALALAVVFVWRIGPVILVLSATHGVHSGDFLAAFPAIGALALVRDQLRAVPAWAYRLRSRAASTATSRMLIAATARPHHG